MGTEFSSNICKLTRGKSNIPRIIILKIAKNKQMWVHLLKQHAFTYHQFHLGKGELFVTRTRMLRTQCMKVPKLNPQIIT